MDIDYGDPPENGKLAEAWSRFTKFLFGIGIEQIFICGEYVDYRSYEALEQFFAEYKELLRESLVEFFYKNKKSIRNMPGGKYPFSGCVSDAFWWILEKSNGKIKVIPLTRATY